MKKKIILHGHLADKYPHPIEVEAATVAEAIQSLATIEELTPPAGQPWPVTVQGVDNEIALFSETSFEEIHVYPRTGGAKKGGLMQVLLGITLIALAVFNPAFIGTLGLSQGQLYLAGGLMLSGGLLQLLAPTPSASDGTESSRYLGASGNTVKIGTRIPLAYGNVLLEGHYLSFDVDAVAPAGDAGSNGVTPIEFDNPKWWWTNPATGEPEEVTETVAGTKPANEITTGYDNVYVEYDSTVGIDKAVVNPIYTSAVASPSNIPTSAWVLAT